MLFLLVITPREGIGWSEHYTRVHQPQVIIVFPPDMNSATTSYTFQDFWLVLG